jgi:hypothetical protein
VLPVPGVRITSFATFFQNAAFCVFCVVGAGSKCHRPLRAGDDLDDAFAWKEERTLSQTLTLQYDSAIYDKVMLILEPTQQARAAIGKRVTVVNGRNGDISIWSTHDSRFS